MKITDITAVYPKYKHLAPSWRTHFWQIVVRVDTDAALQATAMAVAVSRASPW